MAPSRNNLTTENGKKKETPPDPGAEKKKRTAFQKVLAHFQLCPHKSEKVTKFDEKPKIPPSKPPLSQNVNNEHVNDLNDKKEVEWTEVPLYAPDSPPVKLEQNTPIPPPRKHKQKLLGLVNSPIKKQRTHVTTEVALKEVEEPTIVPKKWMEHVCDGTHHHVENIINGKVVRSIVYHKEANGKKPEPQMNKNLSTLSLPSYDDLKKKSDKKSKKDKKKDKESASSLSSDKKNKALKFESYMTRCRSIGSILPHHSKEKQINKQPDSDVESIDSFKGLDDWDLGVIENDIAREIEPNNSIYKQINQDSRNKENFKEITATSEAKTSNNNKEIESSINESKSYPFKSPSRKNGFENDAFFTSEFIKNEIKSSSIYQPHIPTKVQIAPLATFDHIDSDSESEKDKAEQLNSNNDDLLEIMQGYCSENQDKCSQGRENKKSPLPRRNTSKIGHSNLLKFISPRDDTTTVKVHLVDDNVKESQNIPEIKTIEASWQQVVKTESTFTTSVSDTFQSTSDESMITKEIYKVS